MGIKKTDDGWLLDCRPWGRSGKRLRKSFPSRNEAQYFYNHLLAKVAAEKRPKNVIAKDKRPLTELVEIWWTLKGQTLKDAKRHRRAVELIIERLGDPLAHQLETADYIQYRAERMAGKWGGGRRKGEPLTLNTHNHELAYFKGFINDLVRLKEWVGENPINEIEPFKLDEAELTFLTNDEIVKLLNFIDNESVKTGVVVRICLATGARWNEAVTLTRSQLANNKLTFHKTKSFKNRTIPIDKDLSKLIITNLPLKVSYHFFRKAIDRLKIELPDGQLTHVLRHTFASHYMINGGDIITLKNVLGHSSLKMTMRYAHLSPGHMSDVPLLNPLANLKNDN